MNTTFALSVVKRCGCILNNSMQWDRKPLQFSAEPEKVTSKAMGPAGRSCEGAIDGAGELGSISQ